MSTASRSVLEKIQAQGFCGLDEMSAAQFNYPLRIAPAICLMWTAMGTVLASSTILWALVPLAFLGALLPGHPFDVIYNFGLRHLMKRPALPRYGFRRRVGCVAASIALSASALSFLFGIPVMGYIFGSMVAMGTLMNVSTGLCPPAVIMGLLFGKVVCERPS
jgi:hypothetical protein